VQPGVRRAPVRPTRIRREHQRESAVNNEQRPGTSRQISFRFGRPDFRTVSYEEHRGGSAKDPQGDEHQISLSTVPRVSRSIQGRRIFIASLFGPLDEEDSSTDRGGDADYTAPMIRMTPIRPRPFCRGCRHRSG